MTVAEAWLRWALTNPHRPALVIDQQTFSYGDLGQQVTAWVARLEDIAAIQASSLSYPLADPPWGGDLFNACRVRVGMLLPNRVEAIAVFLATVTMGGVAMVLNPDWSTTQVQQVLSHYPVDIVITTESWEKVLPEACPRWILDAMPDKTAGPSLAELFLQSQAIAPEAPFYIGFTSGTTGLPKGIVRHHRSWLDSFATSRQELGLRESDRVLVPGSLAYSLSLFTALDTLNSGATLYLMPLFNPRHAVAQLAQITVLVCVPTLLDAIIRAAQRQQMQWPGVRSLICTGASYPVSLHRTAAQTFPVAVQQIYYGASELSFISLWTSDESPPLESVGRAMAGVAIAICQEDGQPCAVGETGLITVSSTMLSMGYLVGGKVRPLRRLAQGVTVGDRGWLDAKGWLYVAGRDSDRLTTSGITLDPAEVERILEQHPAIQVAAVVGLPDERRGMRLVAVVVGDRLSRQEAIAWVRSRLSKAKCPTRFYRTAQLPVAPSGKLDRAMVQRWVIDHAPQLERLL